MKKTLTAATMILSLGAFAGSGYGEKHSEKTTSSTKPNMESDSSMNQGSAMDSDSSMNSETAMSDQSTIAERAQSSSQFSTFAKAMKAANLTDTLQGDGPFTVFAPTNEAFDKLPKAQLDALLNDPEQLKQVLLYHVAPKRVSSAEAQTISGAQTVHGQKLTITRTGGDVMIGESAKVISPDITASNGVIHAIDTVLMPEKLSE